MTITSFELAPAVALFILLAAALLAWPATWFLTRRYSRAVQRAMAVRGVGEASSDGEAVAPNLRRSLVGAAPYRRGKATSMRRTTGYLVGGAALGAVSTVFFFVDGDIEFLPVRTAVTVTVMAWPGIVAAAITAGTRSRSWRIAIIVYFALLVLLGLVSGTGVEQIFFLWLLLNGPATLLFWVFDRPSVRGAGPIVLAAAVLAVTGALVATEIVIGNDAILAVVASIAVAAGFGSTFIFVITSLAGFLVAGAVGWFLVRLGGSAYANRRVSDEMIRIGAAIIWFTAINAASSSLDNLVLGILNFLFANVAFWLIALAVSRRTITQSASPRVLILRVFSLGRRSAATYREFSRHWRSIGTGVLIAGPDLAAEAMEPDEFLQFASGRLDRLFIGRDDHLKDRLGDVDDFPDLDNRYRIFEFFCRDVMWKTALDALVESAHVVLMDLRSFGPENRGVRYEIEALAQHGALSRTVLLVDRTADTDLLRGLLADQDSEPTIIGHTKLRDVDDLVDTCARLAATDGGRP